MAHAEATVFGPSAAAMLALVGLTYTAAVAGFIVARFALGFGEAGNFPASIKTVAEWFPKKERALATGIFNAGTNVGALVTPLVVPGITLEWGWHWAFVITGAIGFIWLFFWLRCTETPENTSALSAAELAFIQSDPPTRPRPDPVGECFPHRQTWAFAHRQVPDRSGVVVVPVLAAGFSQPQSRHRLFRTIGLPLVAIYLIADVGSVGGGWLSSTLHQTRLDMNAAARRRCSSAHWRWCRSFSLESRRICGWPSC